MTLEFLLGFADVLKSSMWFKHTENYQLYPRNLTQHPEELFISALDLFAYDIDLKHVCPFVGLLKENAIFQLYFFKAFNISSYFIIHGWVPYVYD